MSQKQPEHQIHNIKDLYYALSRIYSCKYADKVDEITAAENELYHAVKTHGYSPEHILKRMQQLKTRVRQAGDFESKLSAQIMTRFWEKNFSDEEIPYRPFQKG